MRFSFPPFAKATKVGLVVLFAASASCGGGVPPASPTVAAPSAPVAKVEPPIDVSAVPEPEGLVMVARVAKPEHVLSVAGSWSRLPLPSGSDLVRSISDDAVGDVVDLARPVDAAVVIRGRDPKPLFAFAVAVRGYDEAKVKLSTKHRLGAGPNGQLTIEGLARHGEAEGDDDDDDDTCVLAPAAEPKGGARIVCGERAALDSLVPYLTRTAPRQTWSSDLHAEVRLAPLRDPLKQLSGTLPILARSMLGGQSPALRELAEAVIGEAVDFVSDATRIVLDSELGDPGAEATVRLEFERKESLLARVAVAGADRAGPPPAAFLHLPAEADVAFFTRGGDPKLFDHARELLGRFAIETAADIGLPEAEKKILRDLVIDRFFTLLTGPLVYGKGFDLAALEKAIATRKAVKPDDIPGEDEADRLVRDQVVGWHLLQVNEPIAKVGPMLKDWATLWQRPAFAKWVKESSSAKMMVQVRTAGSPAGVTLPKDSVHLEVVIPRREIDLDGFPGFPGVTRPTQPTSGSQRADVPPVQLSGAGKPAQWKKYAPKPIVLHFLAVPDQGATWLGFGLDARLLGQRAAMALSSASDKDTLGKSGNAAALRETKAGAGWFVTLRGLLVVTALSRRERTPFAQLGGLSQKGSTPMVLWNVAEPPSRAAAAGSSVSVVKVPRAVVEDIVKLFIAAH